MGDLVVVRHALPVFASKVGTRPDGYLGDSPGSRPDLNPWLLGLPIADRPQLSSGVLGKAQLAARRKIWLTDIRSLINGYRSWPADFRRPGGVSPLPPPRACRDALLQSGGPGVQPSASLNMQLS